MTPGERKIAAKLLRMAADEFSSHGCNDFDLTEVIPDQAERDALVRAYHGWNGDPEEYYEAGSRDYRLMDWMLMDFMAALMEEEGV